MGKRVYIKSLGRCQMTKIVKRGRTPIITLKCHGISKKKIETAQEIIDGK